MAAGRGRNNLEINGAACFLWYVLVKLQMLLIVERQFVATFGLFFFSSFKQGWKRIFQLTDWNCALWKITSDFLSGAEPRISKAFEVTEREQGGEILQASCRTLKTFFVSAFFNFHKIIFPGTGRKRRLPLMQRALLAWFRTIELWSPARRPALVCDNSS